MSAPIVFLDLETTSLVRPGRAHGRRMWEVGMIHRDGSDTTSTSFFVDVVLTDADPFSLNVGGFWKRHPLGQRLSGRASEGGRTTLTEREAVECIIKWTHGAHIVGAVPSFDEETISYAASELGLAHAWHYHLIDVEAMAVGYLQARGHVIDLPYKSDEIGKLLGVEPSPPELRHTALGDARWVERWWDALRPTSVDSV